MSLYLSRASRYFPSENWHGGQKFAAHAPPLGALSGADKSHSHRVRGAHAIGHQIGWILTFHERLQAGSQFFASCSNHRQAMLKVLPACGGHMGDVTCADVDICS